MSNSIRLNITLPAEVGLRLKAYGGNTSRIIAESLTERFEREEKANLEAALKEGYLKRTDDDTSLNADYDYTTGDGIE